MTGIEDICARVRDAVASGHRLSPRGSGSKGGGTADGASALSLADHAGITNFNAGERVITARAGTRLKEIESALETEGLMFGFEPPHLGDAATLGGLIASGLNGPRRAYGLSLRDCLLGVTLVNGRGEILHFGGTVIKNVAGYDVPRLMAGSLGCLGIILEASIRVVPRPRREVTRILPLDDDAARDFLRGDRGRGLPLSGAAFGDGRLFLRLSASGTRLDKLLKTLGGEPGEPEFWTLLRERRLDFFKGDAPLWRLSVPATAGDAGLGGTTLHSWSGAERWLRSDADADTVFAAARSLGGHATRIGDRVRPVDHQPLAAALLALHNRVKTALDPDHVFPALPYAEARHAD